MKHVLLGAVLCATVAGLPAARAQPAEGPYAIVAAGASRYGFDCWAAPFSCQGGTGPARKLLLGWTRGTWALEAVALDFGSASTEASIASLPGETIRLKALGLSVVGVAQMQGGLRLSGRLGVARTRHERSREAPMSTWSPSAGLGLLWQWQPGLGLELAWDLAFGEGSDSGTGMANAYTLGLRVGF